MSDRIDDDSYGNGYEGFDEGYSHGYEEDHQAFDAKLNGLDRNAIRLAALGEKQDGVPDSVRCFATELRDLLLDPDEVDEMHRAAAARALREAADALPAWIGIAVYDWLCERAEKVERGE